MVHARRKFHDARATDPARAHEALARIRRLYDIEADPVELSDLAAGRPVIESDRIAARAAAGRLNAALREARRVG